MEVWFFFTSNMTEKYTKDKLIEVLLNHNTEVTQHLANIATALHGINDTNVLHEKAIIENSETLKKMIDVNTSFLTIFRWMMVVMVAALIILAGAEKALKFLPIK